jgi:hypothetical protein
MFAGADSVLVLQLAGGLARRFGERRIAGQFRAARLTLVLGIGLGVVAMVRSMFLDARRFAFVAAVVLAACVASALLAFLGFSRFSRRLWATASTMPDETEAPGST